MWRDVYEDFSELTKSEQIALFEAMKQDLIPEEPDKIFSTFVRFLHRKSPTNLQ